MALFLYLSPLAVDGRENGAHLGQARKEGHLYAVESDAAGRHIVQAQTIIKIREVCGYTLRLLTFT